MEAKEKVLKLIDQVVQELDGLNSVEVRVVITGVLNEMNMPQIPILILGDMANVMKSNQIVMTEDEGGWHVAFKISNDCEGKDSERSDEDNAPIYQQAPEGADMEKIEKESIIRALQRNHGNRKKAAEDLHISERTLSRKIEKYGITNEVSNK